MLEKVDSPVIIKIAGTIIENSIWAIIDKELKKRITGRIERIRKLRSDDIESDD